MIWLVLALLVVAGAVLVKVEAEFERRRRLRRTVRLIERYGVNQ